MTDSPNDLDLDREAGPPPPAQSWVQSGQLAVAVAIVLFVASVFFPLATLVHQYNFFPPAPTTPYQMIMGEGPHPVLTHSKIILCIPGAALGLLSMLLSRRTREVMIASRPLVFVVSLLPLAAGVLCLMKFKKLVQYHAQTNSAVMVLAMGTLIGLVGAVQFGNTMPSAGPRRRLHDPDDAEDPDDHGP